MNPDNAIGLYGKLPAYGDFLTRNLNATFINPWDEWLQSFISASQDQIGENWLDIYLTSPIWRFVLSPGVIDKYMWCGLLMPSVDRVGRYFPITLVKPVDPAANPVNFMLNNQDWYNELESHTLTALDGRLDVDELMHAVNNSNSVLQEKYLPTINLGELGPSLIGLPSLDAKDTVEALPYIINALMSSSLTSFSLWQSSGSERISPLMFSCQGLPPIGGVGAMLDGEFQQRDWKIPYNLQ